MLEYDGKSISAHSSSVRYNYSVRYVRYNYSVVTTVRSIYILIY